MTNNEVEKGEDIIKYNDSFDPAPIRKRLGLDGHSSQLHLQLEEIHRLANLLFRHGHLSLRDMEELGGWRVPNPEFEEKPFSGGGAWKKEDTIGRPTDK